MRSVNECILIGHVGKEPEVRTAGGGTRIANFSLATSRKSKGEETTDWHRCVAFGKLVDVIEQWVHKGDPLYVRGRIEYSQTEKDGVKRYYTDIVVNDLTMLGSKGEAHEPPAKRTARDEPGSGLPF